MKELLKVRKAKDVRILINTKKAQEKLDEIWTYDSIQHGIKVLKRMGLWQTENGVERIIENRRMLELFDGRCEFYDDILDSWLNGDIEEIEKRLASNSTLCVMYWEALNGRKAYPEEGYVFPGVERGAKLIAQLIVKNK